MDLDRNSVMMIEDDDDIIKVFKKEKVNISIDEAVTRVLSMAYFLEARRQYQRMLARTQETKVVILIPPNFITICIVCLLI